MERLTQSKYPHLISLDMSCEELCGEQSKNTRNDTDACLTCLISKTFEKLAEYEDTGLTPEEVNYLKEVVEIYKYKLEKAEKALESDTE